jgi:hypothetical protein
MITQEEARAIVEKHLRGVSYYEKCPPSIFMQIEYDFGWVFTYQCWELRDRTLMPMLGGNAPFIVDRSDGSMRATGTAYPVEHYVKVYQKHRESILNGSKDYNAELKAYFEQKYIEEKPLRDQRRLEQELKKQRAKQNKSSKGK